jgi:hypothetical protein
VTAADAAAGRTIAHAQATRTERSARGRVRGTGAV